MINSHKPLVSVAIPTYNNPTLLLQTLDSVFAQTFADYEIVVVNDGSTDDTESRLAPLLDRIRLINQPNGGIGHARNRCIDEARGKYVALLDHDDLWHPDKLAAQIDFILRHPECSAVMVQFEDSDRPGVPRIPLCAIDADGLIHHPLRLHEYAIPALTTSFVLFEKAKAQGLRFFELRGAIEEDAGFFLPLALQGPVGVAQPSRILGTYRYHGGNTSASASGRYRGAAFLSKMLDEGYFGNLSKRDLREVQAFVSGICRGGLLALLEDGKRFEALALYLREFPRQLRFGRWRFLLGAPPLMLGPKWLAARLRRSPRVGR